MTDKKQAQPLRPRWRIRFHRAIALSATLSLASLGGSIASCAAQQKPDRIPVEEPAVFCYKTLGEVSCYSAPQPHLGNITALPADPPHMRNKPKNEPAQPVANSPTQQPENPSPTDPAPASTPANNAAPIPLKPDA